MAERRMFAKTIIDSDAFLDMPQSAQLLYFHLAMRADDDGFVNSPKNIMRMIRAATDDLNLLFAKKFLIPFESGVVVIKHWRIHNYIQKDRYKQTKYKDEKHTLYLDENNAYTQDLNSAIKTVDGEDILPIKEQCLQNGYKVDTQDRLELGKDSIEKELGKDNIYISDGFQNFLDMVKEVCPVVYQRYQNKVDNGNLEAAREVKRLLDNILGRTEEFWLESDFEELKEVFARASQTYIVKPKYAGLDIAWVLNNIEKVKNTPIEQQTSAAPKAEKFDAMACLQELYEKHKAEEGKDE